MADDALAQEEWPDFGDNFEPPHRVSVRVDRFSLWLGISIGLVVGWALPFALDWLLGAP